MYVSNIYIQYKCVPILSIIINVNDKKQFQFTVFFTQKSYSIRLCSSVSFTAPHKLDIELTQGCKISYYDDIYYLIDISDKLRNNGKGSWN